MFTLTIDTGNATFEDDPNELSRILRSVAEKLAQQVNYAGELQAFSSSVIDINGNTVGKWELS